MAAPAPKTVGKVNATGPVPLVPSLAQMSASELVKAPLAGPQLVPTSTTSPVDAEKAPLTESLLAEVAEKLFPSAVESGPNWLQLTVSLAPRPAADVSRVRVPA